MNFLNYFEYLKTRSIKSLFFRKIFIYPKLIKYLPSPAVDIGCGIGDMLKYHGNMIGYDINQYLVDFCISRGLIAKKMNLNSLPIADDSLNSLLLDNVLEHMENPSQILIEIHRVLKSKALLIVGVPGTFGYTKDSDHKIFYSPESLIQTITFEKKFELIKIIYIPFKSKFLDKNSKLYSYYGIFKKNN